MQKAVLLLALLLPAARLHAQVIQGLLVDNVNRQPLGGAFVTLIDAAGWELARALTNREGQFVIEAPGPGAYRLRTKQIGFRPQTSEALTVERGQTLPYRLALDPIPVRMTEVVVEGDRQCDLEREGAGPAVALWEEVREALSAVAWTSRVPGYWYENSLYQRDRSENGRIRRDSTWSRTGYLRVPFQSAPAEELAAQGYVTARGDELVYFAPDADALLSDPFVKTHCFEVKQGRGDQAGLIGLAFGPARRRNVPDIRGTLWLDRRTSELRHLEFTYTNLTRQPDETAAGGRIDFLRIPSGAWIVRDWVIRMALRRATGPIGVRESGGRALTIKARDGTLVYSTAAPSVAATPLPPLPTSPCPDSSARTGAAMLVGVARDGPTGSPVAGAEIWATWQDIRVVGSGARVSDLRAETRTDGAGGFTLCGLPVGPKIPVVGIVGGIERGSITLTFTGDSASGGRIRTQDLDLAAAPVATARRLPNVLTEEDIEGSAAVDAYELVQQLRPNWLHRRGPISVRNRTAGQMLVYVDGVRWGGLAELRNIRTDQVRQLHYLTAPEATMRFGTGHGGGVIEVTTR